MGPGYSKVFNYERGRERSESERDLKMLQTGFAVGEKGSF